MKRILSVLAIIIFVTAGAFAADGFEQDPLDQPGEVQVEPADETMVDTIEETMIDTIEEPIMNQEEDFFIEQDVADATLDETLEAIIETTSEVEVPEVDVIPSNVNKKIYIDNYFSMSPLLGFTLSPFDSTDQFIASGLQFDFYKYYGYKNYGTYLKLAVLGEHYAYGSYEIVYGGTYRYVPFDTFELFANIGASVSYYNKMLEAVGTDDVSLLYAGAEAALGFRFYPFKDNNNIALNIGLTGTYMWKLPFPSNDAAISSRYSVIGFVGYTYAFRGKPKQQPVVE